MRMAAPWKHPTTGVWYIRIAVPERLRKTIVFPSGKRGGTLWKRSMGTRDQAEAKRRWPRHLSEWEAARSKAEAELVGAVGDSIARLAKDCVQDLRADEQRWERFIIQSGLQTDWRVGPEDEDDGQWPQELEIHRRVLVRMFGEASVARDEPECRRAAWAAIRSALDNTFTLEDALEGWLKERRPTKNTEIDWRSCVREFGAHRSLSAIRRADVVAFKDRMVGAGKAAGTIKRKLTALRTLFKWAIEHEWCRDNPAAGIEVRGSKVARDKRQPFEAEHLKAIFSGPIHAKGERPKGGGGDAAFWLPILALYTGAREEELGQLTTENVKQERRVWRIEITDRGDGQKVKTVGSRRKVPLHPDIREAFGAYVRERGSGKLFPDLKPDNKGRVTGNFSKFWNNDGRYLRRVIGIKDPRLVFHSFRHTFKDLCRNADIPKDVHDRLGGYAAGDVGDTYGSGHNLQTLATYVARIKVPLAVKRAIQTAIRQVPKEA